MIEKLEYVNYLLLLHTKKLEIMMINGKLVSKEIPQLLKDYEKWIEDNENKFNFKDTFTERIIRFIKTKYSDLEKEK